MLELIST